MKFEPDTAEGANVITHHEPGPPARLWVGHTVFEHSVLVPATGLVQAWPAHTPDELTAAHFEQCLAFKPEVVIFGSGARLRFVKPALYRALIEHRIGVETMDTAAACRTYNVLASERRSVLAALLL